jgi:hypothetical protein
MPKLPASLVRPVGLIRTYLLELVALVAYGIGAYWRVKYILKWHDPRKFVYSDMKLYWDLGHRLAKEGYQPKPSDVTHPPGLTELIAWFVRRDPEGVEKLQTLVNIQLGLSLLIPLCVGFFAWTAFGKRTAYAAIAIASLYYPFIEYGGYFLAEIYMLFLVPLVLGTYLLAVKIVAKSTTKHWVIGLGVAALCGFFFFLTLAMKMVAAPAVMAFFGIHFLFTQGPARKFRAAVLAVVFLAAAPGTKAVSDRCTTANEGKFCFGSNKAGADFLLGHYGRIQGISWKPKQGAYYSFGNPSAYQHGYRDVPEVPFGLFDSKANEELAWQWIRKNPTQAVVLSPEHINDSFVGAMPWPAYATNFWLGAMVAQYIFMLFMLFPTGIHFMDIARKKGVMGVLKSQELAVIAPIFGVCVAVAIATGEIRYRTSWDACFIIVCVEFYRQLSVRFGSLDLKKISLSSLWSTPVSEAQLVGAAATVDAPAPTMVDRQVEEALDDAETDAPKSESPAADAPEPAKPVVDEPAPVSAKPDEKLDEAPVDDEPADDAKKS